MNTVLLGRRPSIHKIDGRTPSVAVALLTAGVLAGWSSPSSAQASQPAAAGGISIPKENEVSESTRRQAEGPARWILFADQLEKEKKKQQAQAAKEVRPATASAPLPVPVKRTQPAAAPTPARSVASTEPANAKPAPDPAPAPAPAIAAPELAAIAPPPAAAVAPVEKPVEALPAPVLLEMVEPYIPDAVRGRTHGARMVVVHFEIAPNGTVRNAKVVESSHPALRQPVLAAIEQWRYAPPGRVVEKQVQLQIADEQ